MKNQHRTEVKNSLNEIMEVYLATVTYFMCDLLFENGYFVKKFKYFEKQKGSLYIGILAPH